MWLSISATHTALVQCWEWHGWQTLGLFLFVYLMLGIVGLQLFMGNLNSQCFVSSNNTWILDSSDDRLCGGCVVHCLLLIEWFMVVIYRHHDCAESCFFTSDSPNYSVSNFNNIGNSMLTIFIASTTEGWVDIMYFLQVPANCSCLPASWCYSRTDRILTILLALRFISWSYC